MWNVEDLERELEDNKATKASGLAVRLGKWLLVALFAVVVGVAWSSPYYLGAGKDAVFGWINARLQDIQDRRDFPAYAACVNEGTEYATVLNVRRGTGHDWIALHWILHYQAVPERTTTQRTIEISEGNLKRVGEVWGIMTRCADRLHNWRQLYFFQVTMGPIGTIDDGKPHVYAISVKMVLLNRLAVSLTGTSNDPVQTLTDGLSGKPDGVAVMAIDVRAAKAYLIHSNTGKLQLALEREDANGR